MFVLQRLFGQASTEQAIGECRERGVEFGVVGSGCFKPACFELETLSIRQPQE